MCLLKKYQVLPVLSGTLLGRGLKSLFHLILHALTVKLWLNHEEVLQCAQSSRAEGGSVVSCTFPPTVALLVLFFAWFPVCVSVTLHCSWRSRCVGLSGQIQRIYQSHTDTETSFVKMVCFSHVVNVTAFKAFLNLCNIS